MKDWPWKHIVVTIAGFVYGYSLTQSALGYDSVPLHFSFRAILVGLSMSGLYGAGLVQTPPGKP